MQYGGSLLNKLQRDLSNDRKNQRSLKIIILFYWGGGSGGEAEVKGRSMVNLLKQIEIGTKMHHVSVVLKCFQICF